MNLENISKGHKSLYGKMPQCVVCTLGWFGKTEDMTKSGNTKAESKYEVSHEGETYLEISVFSNKINISVCFLF